MKKSILVWKPHVLKFAIYLLASLYIHAFQTEASVYIYNPFRVTQ